VGRTLAACDALEDALAIGCVLPAGAVLPVGGGFSVVGTALRDAVTPTCGAVGKLELLDTLVCGAVAGAVPASVSPTPGGISKLASPPADGK
jgi:hypothetical protein